MLRIDWEKKRELSEEAKAFQKRMQSLTPEEMKEYKEKLKKEAHERNRTPEEYNKIWL